MVNLETIPEEEQRDFLATFWVLLGECEALADNSKDAYLERQVEGAFKQWNRVTGQNHEPRWKTRK